MSRSGPAGFPLRPLQDVEWRDGRLVATSTEPWLEVDWALPTEFAGRVAEVVYRASFWDEPVRPLLRFRSYDGSAIDQIAAGPIAGAGIWVGRVPEGTRRLEVSPTNRIGPFGFRIESIRRRSFLGLLAQGFRQQPARARSALLTRLIGWRPESDVNFAWATGAAPLSHFAAWQAARARELDLFGLDAPRFDWRGALPIRVFIAEGDAARLRQTLASLRSQTFPAWTASLPYAAGLDDEDPRLSFRSSAQQAWFPHVDDPDGTLTCRIEAGDRLRPEALAYAVEQAHRHPSFRLFYADGIVIGDNGVARPAFQPGWSARLFAAQPIPTPLLFLRDLKSLQHDEQAHFLLHGQPPPEFLSRLDASNARPLRRLLIEATATRSRPIVAPPPAPTTRATVSVIIPTRDHPALLRRALASIRSRPGPSVTEVVVIDNGSETLAAKDYVDELSRSAHTVCLSHLGPFDFSAMCNAAAAVADGDVFIFLNDDTAVLSADWLERLAGWACEPTIGAVGARLVYPDGLLQHVGVVVGLGGSAGHFGAIAPDGDPGWARRNKTVHEVSAVTGACLAVERSKFEAVGGFDAIHLPVELSDVDLCLKLNARGWQTVVDPAVRLLHEESASRGGATFRRLDVYAQQRAVFVERWRHVLRDDTFFHPGLSLYSFAPALA